MTRALLALVLVSALVPATAAAQSGRIVSPTAGHPVSGPVFGDGELLWTERDDAYGVRLLAADLGRTPEVLATLAAPAGTSRVLAAFGATRSSALLYAVFGDEGYKATPGITGVTALFGPRGAAVRLPEIEHGYAFPRLVADRVAFALFPASTVRFIDPATGARDDVPVKMIGATWDAAGDAIAHRRPTGDEAPVVTNWRTGAELYRAEPPEAFEIHSVRVAPDGTAAWSGTIKEGDAITHRVGISTPDRPAIRLLPTDGVIAFALAGDRVLLSRFATREWEVSDFAGTVLARLPASVASGRPGLDGRRLAYLRRPCAMTVVEVYDFESPSEPKGVAPPRCPAAGIAGRPSVRGRVVSVPLRCDGSEGSGCVTDVSVAVRRRGRQVWRQELRETGLAAGERRAVRLTLGRPPPRGRLRVTVVTVAPRDGNARAVRRVTVRR